jgi:hypothetical protein
MSFFSGLKYGEFKKLGAIVYNNDKTITMAVFEGLHEE